jgi:hypothetical protein
MQKFFIFFFFIFPLTSFPQVDLTGTLDKTRRYNEVTWLAAHNADMSYPNGWMIVNQTKGLKDLMENSGVRALLLDTYFSDDGPVGTKRDKPEIVSCHSSCELTANALRPMQNPALLEDNLKVVKEFLDSNKNEIITIILEDYTPNENKKDLSGVFDKVGLTPYMLTSADTNMFNKNPVVQWPSLNDLLSKNKRLIVFSNRSDPFIYQWSWMVENHYNMGEEKGESCEKRGESKDGLVGQSHTLLSINHFYDFSFDILLAHDPKTRFINHGYFNGPILEEYLDKKCLPLWKRIPNFINIDHAHRHSSVYGGIELGDLIKKLNKNPAWKYYSDESIRDKLFPNWRAEKEEKNEGEIK